MGGGGIIGGVWTQPGAIGAMGGMTITVRRCVGCVSRFSYHREVLPAVSKGVQVLLILKFRPGSAKRSRGRSMECPGSPKSTSGKVPKFCPTLGIRIHVWVD